MSKDSFDPIHDRMQSDFEAVMLGFRVQKGVMNDMARAFQELAGTMQGAIGELRQSSDLQEQALLRIGTDVKNLVKTSQSRFTTLETRVQRLEDTRQAG